MSVNLRALIGKLNHTTRAVVESAAGLCLSRTHYDVEIEHFLVKALDVSDGDVSAIVAHYALDRSRLASDLARSLDHLKSGNARTPAISPHLARMLSNAWMIGSIDFGATEVRTGHALLALLADDDLARLAREISRAFAQIPAEGLRKEFETIAADTVEATQGAHVPSAAAERGVQRAS